LATEGEDTILLFLRRDGASQVEENEEYARAYLEVRGADRWFMFTSSKRLESIKRVLYPLYLVPILNPSSYWVLDATRPIAISAFDDFNSSVLVAQLNYLINQERTGLDFKGESDQALFDHISGALLDYARLQDDYNQDLSSVISREFLFKEYLGLVEAAKPMIEGGNFRSRPYSVGISEKVNSMFSWDEAFKLTGSIEKRIRFMVDYLHRCNDSIGLLETRSQEFEEHVKTSKAEMAKEFDDYKALKETEEVNATEKCETDRQNAEKTYKPLLNKAEKQLKTAQEANEAAQIELMPVQSVYDEMQAAASKLQDSVTQSTAAREEAAQKAAEFRAKYAKLQEDQSSLQARSTKARESRSVPEDTPLDAEMAYLERQALNYESKQQQLDEELNRLSDQQTKSKAEIDKFDRSYRPIKQKADEAKALFDKRREEQETLKQQKSNEVEAIEATCKSELERMRSETTEAETVLGQRLSSIDKSYEKLKSAMDRLKVTLASSQKYVDETMKPGLGTITLAGDKMPQMVYYPFYMGSRSDAPIPIFVTGSTIGTQTAPTASEAQGSGPTYTPNAIDSYVKSKLSTFQWNTAVGDLDLFAQIEFKGRLIAGFKELAREGLLNENKMLKLAREVAVIDLSLG
jgi:hypothetical protein